MVIDGLKSGAVGGLAADQPFGAPIVDLSVGVPVSNRLLDFGCLQSSVAKAHLRVFGPDETLDLHGRSLFAVQARIWMLRLGGAPSLQ